VGMVDSIPFYSSKVNAWWAIALWVLVDSFSFAYEKLQTFPQNHLLPKVVMNKTSPTIKNCVVLCENNEYETVHGKFQTDYHLICMLLRYTQLIPQSCD
jgi:hypothetical protein